ncbi:MAG: hypothetical protein ABIA93_02215 [Candidatus Woesearchaeota archaeon]
MSSHVHWTLKQRVSYSLGSLMLVAIVGGALALAFGALNQSARANSFGGLLLLIGFALMFILFVMLLVTSNRMALRWYVPTLAILLILFGLAIWLFPGVLHVVLLILVILFAYLAPLIVAFKAARQSLNTK